MKRLICPADEARAIAELKAGERLTVWREIKDLPSQTTSVRPTGSNCWQFFYGSMFTFRRPTYPAGTEVWVAEMWAKVGDNEDDIHACPNLLVHVYFRADSVSPEYLRWRPSSTMPQRYSRSRLIVREVGVEGGRWRLEMEKAG